MNDTETLIDRYVAVWNEPDPKARRERIEALWSPWGATTHRLLDARGLDAIYERVTGAHDKWVRDAGNLFRPAEALAHHEVVRFVWDMVHQEDGEVRSRALSYLVLDDKGRLSADYQFPLQAPAHDAAAQELADAYVTFWNEPDARVRSQMAKELWTPCGGHADKDGVQRGLDEILTEAERITAAFVRQGTPFRQDGAADGHHGAVQFAWSAGEPGDLSATGYSLLLVEANGLIGRAYTFDDPEPRRALLAA